MTSSVYGIIKLGEKSCHICTRGASGTLTDCWLTQVGQKTCSQHEATRKLSDGPQREGMEILGLLWIIFKIIAGNLVFSFASFLFSQLINKMLIQTVFCIITGRFTFSYLLSINLCWQCFVWFGFFNFFFSFVLWKAHPGNL